GGTCTVGAVLTGTNTCTVIVNGSTPGTGTVNVQADVPVSTVTVHVDTNGHGAFQVSNQKTWVDANIQITPLSATNPIGPTHTLTGHVNVNLGTGFVNAPDNTTINFSIVSGPGSFTGSSSCLTSGGTGSCTTVITSSTAGTT